MNFIHKVLFLSVGLVFPALATHVAVLETTAAKDVLTLEEKQYLTDVLRSEAVKALPAEQNYTIMTRENISVMLPPGTAVEDCEGSCLVETGKNIAADFVAQGHVGRFANNLTITVELYETAGNKLVASFNGNGKNVDALLKVIKENAPEFFGKVKSNRNAGSGGIGEASSVDPDANEDAEEDADKLAVTPAKDVQFDDDDDDMPRSNKPINEVPTVKNTQNRVWIRLGLISGGSVLLTTGLVLAAFAGEEDEYETDYDTWEMKKKKGDDGTLQFGIGIALSIIGAAGIVVGFCF